MTIKSFVFRENWVGSKVAGMEKIFFAIFHPTWNTILAHKGSNKECLKQHFTFQYIRKAEVVLLSILCL